MRLALFLILSASPLMAGDLHVGPGQSLQGAINLASPGDRVLVAPGHYSELIDFGGKAIEVIGLAGPTQTTIDGRGSGPVVFFGNSEGPASLLQGFTITGGHGSFGAGGIHCLLGATPSIEDCIIRDNSGRHGAGVSGSPILRRCSILNNRSGLTSGGGVYGAPRMSYCVVAGNSASSADGGGLYLVGGNASLHDCIVVGTARSRPTAPVEGSTSTPAQRP